MPSSPTPLLRPGILPFCKAVNIHSSVQAQCGLCYCSLGNLCAAGRGGLTLSTLTALSCRLRSYRTPGLFIPRCSRPSAGFLCVTLCFPFTVAPPAVLVSFSCPQGRCSDIKTWACAMGGLFLGYSSETRGQKKEMYMGV